MSLKISNITLDDFRGYSHLSIDGMEDLSIIVGPNAVGKTNIIEAIQLLTAANSFRRPTWSETISWGRPQGSASISIIDDKRQIDHRITIKDNERIYEVNGKKKSAQAVQGTLPCILFTPDDLQLIKASSVKRRDFVDSLAVQLSKNYSSLKSDYQQTLKQRNLLIKEGMCEGSLFDSWNESLAVHGARLCLSRWRLFDRLFEYTQDIYKQIVPAENLQALYIPSWDRFDEELRQIKDLPEHREGKSSSDHSLDSIQQEIMDAADKLKNQEISRSTSLVGPHKDEISFYINGRNARMFASQGQQRTIVLALKLASVELVREMMGAEPVLLLDDVMSELDESHRDAMMVFIERGAQAFITTTNLDYFSKETLDKATVIEVPIPNTRYEY